MQHQENSGSRILSSQVSWDQQSMVLTINCFCFSSVQGNCPHFTIQVSSFASCLSNSKARCLIDPMQHSERQAYPSQQKGGQGNLPEPKWGLTHCAAGKIGFRDLNIPFFLIRGYFQPININIFWRPLKTYYEFGYVYKLSLKKIERSRLCS